MNNIRPSKISVYLLLLLVIPTLLVSVSKAQDATPTAVPLPHWEYEGNTDGPAEWGALDARFAACSAGKAQSPIDLKSPVAGNFTNIKFDYKPSVLNIFNNGHTVQVNYDAGSSITFNETKYGLLQFHFHHPSEHTLNGKAFAMELHFVHRSAAGNLAVVGVLIAEGKENEALKSVFDNLPTTKGDPQPSQLMTDAAKIIPADANYYTYTGSLTTPPCTEGVRWLVLDKPIELSAAQIETFGKIFELDARPVQALNDRDLLEDTTAGS
ncbi:MAG: carbonic anhydrase family protein [Anaerolineae bacterium]|nr:carbonic anhydrase family protein [Anaerolineae bacterium]